MFLQFNTEIHNNLTQFVIYVMRYIRTNPHIQNINSRIFTNVFWDIPIKYFSQEIYYLTHFRTLGMYTSITWIKVSLKHILTQTPTKSLF